MESLTMRKLMSSKTTVLFIVAAVMLGGVYCGSSEKKTSEEPKPTTPTTPKVRTAPDLIVKGLNDQLSKVPLKGFAFGEPTTDVDEYRRWAKAAAPVVSGVISKMPDGYDLEVQGHACAKGTDAANQRISYARASYVHSQLKKEGVTSPKLTKKGYAATRLANTADPEAAENRRVTFQVVEK